MMVPVVVGIKKPTKAPIINITSPIFMNNFLPNFSAKTDNGKEA